MTGASTDGANTVVPASTTISVRDAQMKQAEGVTNIAAQNLAQNCGCSGCVQSKRRRGKQLN